MTLLRRIALYRVNARVAIYLIQVIFLYLYHKGTICIYVLWFSVKECSYSWYLYKFLTTSDLVQLGSAF